MTTTAAMNVAAVTQLCGDARGRGRRRRPAVLRLDLRWARLLRLAVATRVVRLVWDQLLACSSCGGGGGGGRYRRLGPPHGADVLSPVAMDDDGGVAVAAEPNAADAEDVVGLKVSLLGDCHIGKTSFMVKYVGDGEEHKGGLQMTGLNLMDKTLAVRGARLAFNIWDVAGDSQSADHVPIACKDAVAILFMFDLTSRCTLNNIIDWYERARKWNKTGIPILIGTKFDDFAQLPLEMQWAIVDQAPLTVHDPDFEGIVDFEDDELLCFHNMKPVKCVAFEGALTGRFYGCGQEVGTCAFVSWVDEEWPDSLKIALHKLWGLYHDCRSARVQAGLDHAEQVLKLEDKIKQSDIQYSNLVKDVHQLIDQQMKQCYNENYNQIMTGDEDGMKELDKKTYVIQDLKAIHVAQGEVIGNMRKERDG